MNIQPINNVQSQHNVSFKRNNSKVGSYIPGQPAAIIYGDAYKEFEKKFRSSLNERKDELYEFLNSVPFGEDKDSTDAIAEMFEGPKQKIIGTFFHKTMQDNIPDILENGFNPDKIASTKYGPGFYFSGSEGAIQIYSGSTICAMFKGTFVPGRNLKNYGKINAKLTDSLVKYLGIKPDYNRPTYSSEARVLSKFAGEYVREKIVNDLGIDAAHERTNNYFIVFNPKAIKKIMC